MRNHFIGSIRAVSALLAFSPAILAQTAAQPGAATTQAAVPTAALFGIWQITQPHARGFNPKETPHMTSWAEEKFKLVREGIESPDIKGRDDIDPIVTRCAPPGVPRILLQVRPFEFIPLPGRVLMRFEWDHWVRQIWTDGREHPKDPDPTWMGHSIARWDGDTFVVDTIGLMGNDKTWLDKMGHPHSEALHLVERYRRVDPNTLVVDLTFDDPKAYQKPWTGQAVFDLWPDWEIAEMHACENQELYGDFFLKGTPVTGTDP